MNNESIFQQILEIIPLMSFPIFIVIYTRSVLKGINNDLKETNADEKQGEDYERQELEKYLSGFDYV